MSRREFLADVIGQVKNIPVEDVVGNYIQLKRYGSYHRALCPFHATKNDKAFVVTPAKKIWHCFSCDIGGDSIKFVSEYLGMNWIDAALKIAQDFGIISLSDYEAYRSCEYDHDYIVKLEKIRENNVVEEEQPKRAPAGMIHKVYQFMKELSGISKTHRKHLKEERNLSDEQIDYSYFTFPNGKRKKNEILQNLLERLNADQEAVSNGWNSIDQLILVPGFFLRKTKTGEYALDFASYSGIGILIKNPYGYNIGIQIRRDKINENESRYIWFSSGFAFTNKEKYRGGCGSGSPKDVLYPQGAANFVAITEGRFKSEVLASKGGTVAISVQGIGNWRGVDRTIRDINTRTGKEINSFLFFFDSDIFFNRAIFEQTRNLFLFLKEKFPHMHVLYAVWDYKKGKGIDDFLNAGNAGPSYIDAETAINACDTAYEHTLNLFGVSDQKEIPKEKIEAYEAQLYNSCMSGMRPYLK